MTVHRWWRGAPDPTRAWITRAVESTQRHQLIDWTDATMPGPVVADGDVRHVANVARYWLLWRFGGLWLDHDVVPLTDLCTGEPWTAAVGDQRCGAIMWFPRPGHPLAKELVDAARAAPPDRAPVRSGDHLLTRLADRHPDVAADRSVLGFDSTGRRLVGPARAVHLWRTSSAP